MALNRPPIEDLPEAIQPSEIQTLLPGSQTHVFRGMLHAESSSKASELWPILMAAVLMLAIIEALLSASFTTKKRLSTVGQYQPDPIRVSSVDKASS